MTVGELIQRLRYYDNNTEVVIQDLNCKKYDVARLETGLQETVVQPTFGEPPIGVSAPQVIFVAKEQL